jgi:hypothetical protein
MSKILILLFLISSSFANTDSCEQEVTQVEKNECMIFERNKAIGDLMKKVTIRCSRTPELKAAKGGSIYPMLLDECIEKEVRRLVESLE